MEETHRHFDVSTQAADLRGRRRRRRRQLLLLQTSGFGSPDDGWLADDAAAVLQASSLLDEHALRATWRQGRDRLVAMAEFERHADPVPAAHQLLIPLPSAPEELS